MSPPRPTRPSAAQKLRRAAEARLAGSKPERAQASRSPARPPDPDVVEELRVHQIELEMQNEELRRAQVALEESRDRYADLYDFAPVGYLTLQPGDRVAEANLTAAALLDTERPRLVGRRLHDFVAARDAERWDRHCAELRLHAGTRHVELLFVRRDGTTLPAHLDCAAVDAFGTAAIRVALSDMTERVRLEAERREVEARLVRGQRLESLAVLAGGVAHDLNNSFATILLNLEMASTQLEPESPAQLRLQGAVAALQRAAVVTRQMLEYAGRAPFRPQLLDLSALVESSAPLLQAIHPARFQLGQGLPRVSVDPQQVRHLLLGLVTNAAEAIGEGRGGIRVSTGTEEYDEERLLRGSNEEPPAPGLYVWLEVADEGGGMDEATRRRAFEPFFSTKFPGRGLGLAAALGIVKQHGGTLFLDSERGRGTSVRAIFRASTGVPDPRARG